MSCYKHGHTVGGVTTVEYKTWRSMLERCYKTYSGQFKNYGARGIRVVKRWHKFENFYADMGPRPRNKKTLERVKNDCWYSPSNCVWATATQQNRNKRDTVKLTFRGRTLSMAEWARKLGIPKATVTARIRRYGMSVERAFTLKRKQ